MHEKTIKETICHSCTYPDTGYHLLLDERNKILEDCLEYGVAQEIIDGNVSLHEVISAMFADWLTHPNPINLRSLLMRDWRNG